MEGAGRGHGEDATEQGARSRRKGRGGSVSDGIQQGLAVLSALGEVLEETLRETRDRGEASTGRAKEALRSAAARAQEAAGEARERFNLVSRTDFEQLQERVEELDRRLKNLEGVAHAPGAGASRPESD